MNEEKYTEAIPLQINDKTAIPMEVSVQLAETMSDAFSDYSKSAMTPKEWALSYFSAQFPDVDKEVLVKWADEIDSVLTGIDAKKKEIDKSRNKGIAVDDWFASDVASVTAQMGSQEASRYVDALDNAIDTMNQEWYDAVIKKSGTVNLNPNLDGFIAETHHVNSFNADAAAKGSEYRAEVLKPGDGGYNKNSVDIVIRDGNGKIVRRYQSKYGADTGSTEALFKKGDFRGQRKLVPQGQDVQNSTDHIEMDGVKSEPLSKEDAKKRQQEVQQQETPPVEDYDAFKIKTMLKQFAGDVAMAGVIATAMSAAFEIGRKLAADEDVDFKDIAGAALKGGGAAAAKTAAACAVKVVIEKGIFKFTEPLKGVPLGPIVCAIDIGISNVRTLYRIGKGEISIKDGIYEMEVNIAAGVAAFLAASKGVAIGAGIGIILGPVGAAIGGFVGGVIGGLAGATAARYITKALQSVRELIWSCIKLVGRAGRELFEAMLKSMDEATQQIDSVFA